MTTLGPDCETDPVELALVALFVLSMIAAMIG